MALISPESLDRVKQAADIVEVISAHTDLRRRRPLHRPLPVPRRAHALVLGRRRRKSSTTASAAGSAAT